MRNTWNFLLLLLLGGMATSCQDVIDIDSGFARSQLAVEGWVYDETLTQRIRLSRTQQYFDASRPAGVEGAIIDLYENDSLVGTYESVPGEPGNYRLQNFSGSVGNVYTVDIKVAEGGRYTASSIMKRVPPIDSMPYEFVEGSTFQPDPGYFVELFAVDPVGVGDFYRFTVSRNGEKYDGTDNINVFDDLNTDGIPFIPPVRIGLNPEPFQLGDSIVFTIESLDAGAYRFWIEAGIQINNQGLFSEPIANIFTNVKNVDPNGVPAVGYFGASAVSRQGITIR